MKIKKSIGERVFDTCNTILMLFLMLICLYPLVYVLFASVSNPTSMIMHKGLLLWPLGFQTEAYKMVFKNPMILIGYGNTLVYVVVGTTINLFMTSIAAYGLSRKHVYFKNAIMFLIVFTMFFSGGLIPTYLLVKSLGMIDKWWVMVVPTAMTAWNLIIMRTAFAAVPDSMEESARLDGANDFTILFKIIIPLCMPVIAVMTLFYGVSNWNAWFNAMVYLRSRTLFPLQLVLREILLGNDTDNMTTSVGNTDKAALGESIKYATIIVATIPILFVYPFLQKYFAKGVMIGAIKG